MRKIIDSNQLQSESLRAYLAASKSNFAVLADYAAMEAYKGSTLKSIYKSMEIVSNYPDQVIILKGTQIICGINGRSSGLQRRMIDEKQTRKFPEYVRGLQLAKNGNLKIQNHLLLLGTDANNHLQKMLVDAESMGRAIQDVAQLYSKGERKLLRTKNPYSTEMVDKIVLSVIKIAGQLFHKHPNVSHIPTYGELANTFIFRASLCLYILAMDWVAVGGVTDAKPEKLRNDMVDVCFAAYATFFDGLMSADEKALRVHSEARLFLSALFDCYLPRGLNNN